MNSNVIAFTARSTPTAAQPTHDSTDKVVALSDARARGRLRRAPTGVFFVGSAPIYRSPTGNDAA